MALSGAQFCEGCPFAGDCTEEIQSIAVGEVTTTDLFRRTHSLGYFAVALDSERHASRPITIRTTQDETDLIVNIAGCDKPDDTKIGQFVISRRCHAFPGLLQYADSAAPYAEPERHFIERIVANIPTE